MVSHEVVACGEIFSTLNGSPFNFDKYVVVSVQVMVTAMDDEDLCVTLQERQSCEYIAFDLLCWSSFNLDISCIWLPFCACKVSSSFIEMYTFC